eukprot:Skav211890  [mRNA]  locus=scaffold2402:145650:145871:- [translate_table: standard]
MNLLCGQKSPPVAPAAGAPLSFTPQRTRAMEGPGGANFEDALQKQLEVLKAELLQARCGEFHDAETPCASGGV